VKFDLVGVEKCDTVVNKEEMMSANGNFIDVGTCKVTAELNTSSPVHFTDRSATEELRELDCHRRVDD
jgi:hypothetical protein